MSGRDCPRGVYGDSLDEFDECPVCHVMLVVNEDGESVCLWCTEGIA